MRQHVQTKTPSTKKRTDGTKQADQRDINLYNAETLYKHMSKYQRFLGSGLCDLLMAKGYCSVYYDIHILDNEGDYFEKESHLSHLLVCSLSPDQKGIYTFGSFAIWFGLVSRCTSLHEASTCWLRWVYGGKCPPIAKCTKITQADRTCSRHSMNY